jgi:hypothetical protein
LQADFPCRPLMSCSLLRLNSPNHQHVSFSSPAPRARMQPFGQEGHCTRFEQIVRHVFTVRSLTSTAGAGIVHVIQLANAGFGSSFRGSGVLPAKIAKTDWIPKVMFEPLIILAKPQKIIFGCLNNRPDSRYPVLVIFVYNPVPRSTGKVL